MVKSEEMITTTKDIEQHITTCPKCGARLEFASNQPSGDWVPLMCEQCYNVFQTEITGQTNKFSFKMRDKTFKLRVGVLQIFREIGRAMTVRQVFYQAVSKGLVPKDEKKGYNVIQRCLLEMRRYGHIPYHLVSDLSRSYYKQESYAGLGDALQNWMAYYRQDLWYNKDTYVEIWLEKQALTGIFKEITDQYDVPLYVARGFSSESFLFDAAQDIKRMNKKTFIYFFSDYDPSGLQLAEQVQEKLLLFGCNNIMFIREALTSYQIKEFNLPSRPTKKSNHSKNFEGESTELDALHPNDLQHLIEQCIMSHFSRDELANLKMEEDVQKESLEKLATNFFR